MVDIHLCQPDSTKSCAACCGIYNYVENTRPALLKRFEYREALFSRVQTGELSLDGYRDILRHREDGRRIFKTIYSCEFAGFVDGERKRVGCMLHPMVTGGCDLRVHSFYGREICDGHFCPSYQKLASNEASIVLFCIDDWYLYGSVVTDIDFIKTFFTIVQNRIAEEISPAVVGSNPVLAEILKGYFSLKVAWPFRDTAKPRFGKYYFVGEEYDIDRIDYSRLGAEIPAYDPIYLSLSSHFETKDDLDRARTKIDTLIKGFCDEYGKAHDGHH